MTEFFEELRDASRQQLALRGAIVVAAVLCGVAVLGAGDGALWPSPWLLGLPVLALGAAVNPHTAVPVMLMIYLVGLWLAGVPEPVTPWSLLGAGCLLVIHAAASLAASVPAPASLPAGLWRLYAPRIVVVLGVTVVVWASAWLMSGAAVGGGVVGVLIGLMILLTGAVAHHRWAMRSAPA